MTRNRIRFFIGSSRSRAAIASASLALLAVLAVHSPAAVLTTGNVTPDPTTTTNQSLYVGNTANGTMTIDSGSTVSSGFSYVGYATGVTGLATITGPGSKWTATSISIGEDGNGQVLVSNGGAIAGWISVGSDDAGVGLLTITGAGSQVTGSFLDVGDWGTGTLNINSGGKAISTFGSVGGFGAGTATIDGIGSSWQITSSIGLGFGDLASLTVQNGGTLSSSGATINQASDPTSILTVTGAGSAWNNTGTISIGSFSGEGLLQISQGGIVNSSSDTTVGSLTLGSTIGLDNGTLNTGGLLTAINDLDGTGTINTHGLVTDVNLVFNQSNGLQKQIIFTDGLNQNITVNLDQSAAGSLGAGYSGNGSLTIAEGLVVNSRNGVLGYRSGSSGVATVDGAGSKWVMTGSLTVGSSGTASLAIKNGAVVEVAQTTTARSSGNASIAFDTGTLNTRSLQAGASQLGGTGTINTRGLVSDVDLIFDATHPFQQQLVLNSLPNQNVTINLNVDGTGAMGAGYRGVGSLTIADGKVLNSSLGSLGVGTGSTGTAKVSGPGSKWVIASTLNLGPGGTAVLTIENGASVSNQNAQINRFSSVKVSGLASSWANAELAVGGSLLIEAGATVTSVSPSSGGSQFASTGIGNSVNAGSANATIDGPGSTWTHTGPFAIGGIANGTLIVSGGGKLASTIGLLGNGFSGSSGSATVTGPGSLWSNSGDLIVGSETSATLLISDGGKVTNSAGIIADGFGSSSPASATVTGAGSTWINSAGLTVGNSGSGTLTVAAGGSVSSTTGGISAFFAGASTATISGANSRWTMSSALAVGGYFFLSSTNPSSGGPGTLTIGPGGTVQTAGDTTIFSRGQLNLQGGTLITPVIRFQVPNSPNFNWTGGTLHVGTYNGNLTNAGGTLSPGSSPGKTTITGTYTQQATSTLEIEIGGTTSVTQYDLVAITGTTTLGGLLKLSMLNGFLPNTADTFTVLTSGGTLSGAFSNIPTGQRLATSDGFGSFLVTYNNTSRSVVLSAFQAVPEPSTLALITLCATSILAHTRRRANK